MGKENGGKVRARGRCRHQLGVMVIKEKAKVAATVGAKAVGVNVAEHHTTGRLHSQGWL